MSCSPEGSFSSWARAATPDQAHAASTDQAQAQAGQPLPLR
jgi:hypothetical protein